MPWPPLRVEDALAYPVLTTTRGAEAKFTLPWLAGLAIVFTFDAKRLPVACARGHLVFNRFGQKTDFSAMTWSVPLSDETALLRAGGTQRWIGNAELLFQLTEHALWVSRGCATCQD